MNRLHQLIDKSIERLTGFEPEEGYYVAFSGGKDSIVVKQLMKMAGVRFDAHYSTTSVDPPELVRFIKDVHPDVSREIPRDADGNPITMWKLIPKKRLPPTRLSRYCCQILKEDKGYGRLTVTGVRWAESLRRKNSHGVVTLVGGQREEPLLSDPNFKRTVQGGVILTNDNADSRKVVETCYQRHKTTLNPIIDWEDSDVWNFIRSERIPYCSLYDEGFARLGCVGCPMATVAGRQREFARWPKYYQQYLRTFERMLVEREKRGLDNTGWEKPEDVMHWWLNDGVLSGQTSLFDTQDGGST